MSSEPTHQRPPAVRRLPLAGLLRLRAPSDIWVKPALSVVIAAAVPNLTLLVLGRLDLAMYTMAGSLCALYCHNLPYAARAKALARVALGMVAGLAVALLCAAYISSVPLLIAIGALLAALQKTVCDATRVGPPGNLIFAFITSATLFSPQAPGAVPGRLALAVAAAALAWVICMAPALLRPHGPERRAVSRALNAAAAFADTDGTGPGAEAARAATAGAIHAAWQSLLATGVRTAPRRDLERLVVRAEVALAAPADTDAALLRGWAHDLCTRGPVPGPAAVEGTADELLGIDVEMADRDARGRRHPLLRAFAPGSPLLPIALRTVIGCALAGYASYALGVGRPYWAIVTAASLYQANLTLTWTRGVQRVVGNLLGVLAFVAVVPLAHLNQTALVLACLAFNFGAEALMARNYWLGSICVTPMALLITEFAHFQQTSDLAVDRVVDTVVGAAVGILAAMLVTNRRAADRIERALDAAERAHGQAESAVAAQRPDAAALETGRRRLAAALVDLREATDTAAGEWWQRALPQQRVVAAEQAGHRTLAATVRRQGLTVPEGARA